MKLKRTAARYPRLRSLVQDAPDGSRLAEAKAEEGLALGAHGGRHGDGHRFCVVLIVRHLLSGPGRTGIPDARHQIGGDFIDVVISGGARRVRGNTTSKWSLTMLNIIGETFALVGLVLKAYSKLFFWPSPSQSASLAASPVVFVPTGVILHDQRGGCVSGR